MNGKNTIKYTATLSTSSIDELKSLADRKIVPSVNFAIREAIEAYIVRTKKELYEKAIREASQDEDFLRRTFETQEAFSFVDSEIGEDL